MGKYFYCDYEKAIALRKYLNNEKPFVVLDRDINYLNGIISSNIVFKDSATVKKYIEHLNKTRTEIFNYNYENFVIGEIELNNSKDVDIKNIILPGIELKTGIECHEDIFNIEKYIRENPLTKEDFNANKL